MIDKPAQLAYFLYGFSDMLTKFSHDNNEAIIPSPNRNRLAQ